MKIGIGFANVGRGGVRETDVAYGMISDSMDMFAGDQAALLLNEVDEADLADEHGIISSMFRRWQDHAWDSREPILTRGLRVRWSHSFRAARGVARQSPSRPIHEVFVDTPGDLPDIVLMGGHYPAGAHNGERSVRVKAQLVLEYTRMLRLHRKRIRHHHRNGRHVIWAMDTNWRKFPPLHRAEGTLVKHFPDYIRVIPAKGYQAHRREVGSVRLPIEPLHRLEWVVVEFSQKEK